MCCCRRHQMGKKGAGKIPVSKQVWQWTECTAPEDVSDEHVRTAYRLNLGKCTSCRKNCAGNPLCLRVLGESHWLREASTQTVLQADIADLDDGIRKDGDFVGLRNLGATCYVNTFLQLWFHNLSFREAVYKFQEDYNSQEGNGKSPQTVCGQLQLIFGMLQLSARKNIDPTPLVTALGLDTGLQQDAQEFSKLFLSLLESTPGVGELLCQEFCGEYDYCTKCHTCGHISRRPSKFYELDLSIQGHKDVTQCLSEFFKDEKLDAENQYHCDSCACKRDASRRIDIKSLPRTLNLQLLRFVFDKTTWNKKKLSNFVAFPDILDMSPYISSEKVPQEDKIYELTAVLIHRGPSASSGHYIAHIKDDATHLWHKFNDESIVEMKGGKKLDLDAAAEDDFESELLPKPAKKPKLKKNTHSSKNGYMLVYTKKTVAPAADGVPSVPEIPPVVKKAVDDDNNDFFSCIDSVKEEAKQKAEEDMQKHDTMGRFLKEMYSMDTVELLANYYWVPQTWLKQMLDPQKKETASFAAKQYSCAHKKLDPDKVGGMKCIPACLADHLFSMCKEENPRLSKEALCVECVKDHCSTMRSKARLKADHATVTLLLKDLSGATADYYIGRSTLRYWKTLAQNALENKAESVAPNEEEAAVEPTDKNSQDSEDEDDLSFNEDLLCEHGNLSTDTSVLRTVPATVWSILQTYFPDAKVYPVSDCDPCSICTADAENEAQTAELKKMIVHEQRNRLADLLHNRNRPTYKDVYDGSNQSGGSRFYVVPALFVQQWRDYIKNSSKNQCTPVSEVNNNLLLCPHRRLLCDPVLCAIDSTVIEPGLPLGNSDPGTVLIWPQEWDYITKNFIVDVPISVTRRVAEKVVSKADLAESKDVSTDSENGHMPQAQIKTCNGLDLTHDEVAKGDTIKVSDAKLSENDIRVNITPAGVESGNTCNKNVSLKFDPEICVECIEGKKLERERSLRNYKSGDIYVRKVVLDGPAKFDPESYFCKSGQPTSTARRSRRVHTTRGEKKITVSSDWSLKELKIKIMSLFSIPPFDQNIWLDSRKLLGDEATLGQLHVVPDCTLSVVADEPDEKSLEMLPVLTEKQPMNLEEGFKGTSLVSN